MVDRKYVKVGVGAGVGIVTILGLFMFLSMTYGFQIIDRTGNINCLGTYESPCISEFMVKNPTKYNVDIYSKDQVKLDFSPTIKDYALFTKDGRCGATGSCRCELEDGGKIGFKGWRCIDFTNKTKPLKDRVYNFRFPSYSETEFRLVGIKNNPTDKIKWGFGIDDTNNSAYLDPEWDKLDRNKEYNSVKKEVKIKDKDGEEIAILKLNTPLNYPVPRGYQKVAEFELEFYKDNEGSLDLIELFDLKKSMNKIERTIDYKYKTYKDITIQDYETQCTGSNQTKDYQCSEVNVGSHIKVKEVWLDLDKQSLKKNEILTIGVFTEVKMGDSVEWIPTFFGTQIEEWAAWTESLNSGQVLYYKLDEGSGTIIDAFVNINGTNNGADNTTGKINTAYNFVYENTDNITSNSNTGISGAEAFSMNSWVKRDEKTDGSLLTIMMIGKWGANDDVTAIQFGLNGVGNLSWTTYGGGACEDNSILSGVTLFNEWHMITATYDGTNGRLYVDGNNIYNCSATFTIVDSPFYIGANTQVSQVMNGTIDEAGLWNRTLNTSEISQLYNGGSGLPYGVDLDTPTWSNNETNITSTTLYSNSVYFNITLSDLNPDKYIFSWYNGTAWVNDSATSYTNGEEISIIKQINLNSNSFQINWTFYFNDTRGYSNQSDIWNVEIDNIYGFVNMTLESGYVNLTAELGTKINVTATINDTDMVYINIDHPEYGTNYASAVNITNVTFSFDYFRKDELNDSSTSKNISWVNGGNNTIYVVGHQYDELINLSLNFTGYDVNSTYPTSVKIYVNNTLSNSLGFVASGSINLDELNDSSKSYNVTFNESGSKKVYLHLPKNANITSATFNLTGYEHGDYSGYIDGTSEDETYSGIFRAGNPPTNAYDSSYSTLAMPNGRLLDCDTYENYTVPSNTFYAEIRYKHWLDSSADGFWYIICYDEDTGKGIQWSYSFPLGGTTDITETLSSECYDSGELMIYNTMKNYYWDYSVGYYESSIYFYNISYYPANATLEIGTVDGTREWTDVTGTLDYTNTTEDLTSTINTYLDTCTEDSNGFCDVPITVLTASSGTVNISGIDINYTINPNPIYLDYDLVNDFINSSTNFTDIPIKIQSSYNGTIKINDVRYDYAGGNDTIKITAHNVDYTSNVSRFVTFYYSDWDYDFPSYIDYLEFIPRSPSQKNVTPYGQTNSRPILNITTYNYGNKDMNLSIYLNGTSSCVNITISNSSSKSHGTQLTSSTWINLLDDREYLNNSGLWLWSDYECNYTYWQTWVPDFYFRSCAEDVNLCSEDFI